MYLIKVVLVMRAFQNNATTVNEEIYFLIFSTYRTLYAIKLNLGALESLSIKLVQARAGSAVSSLNYRHSKKS